MKALLPLAAALMLAIAAPALAHSFKAGAVDIGHPASRPALKGATGVGYLSLSNTGKTAATLVRIESAISDKVELHESRTVNGVARMSALPAGAPVAPGATVKFEPGGKHVMFVGLKQALKVGDKFPASLVFKDGTRAAVEFVVEAAAVGAAAHAGH